MVRKPRGNRFKVTHSCGHTREHETAEDSDEVRARLKAQQCAVCRKTDAMRERLRRRDPNAVPELIDDNPKRAWAAIRKRVRLMPDIERTSNAIVRDGDRRAQRAFRLIMCEDSVDWWLELTDDPFDTIYQVIAQQGITGEL